MDRGPTVARRAHAAGEATRVALMQAAERLFAERGIDGVTMREIQESAGQSNVSVISYHFGSKLGLVQALIRWRSIDLDRRRTDLLADARATESEHEPRTIVWVVVRPLVESIRAGAMFVPFLARLSENPRATKDYWPEELRDWTSDMVETLVDAAVVDMPDRLWRGRTFQLYNSILNLLGEQARAGHPISEVQLSNFIDAWVGLLTAPVSPETERLVADREAHESRPTR
ncbi:TetR/AcrR family transcriptional regulator [Gordonia liuliyuniae]|uniref:TetR/AcrR family transcriptional regulator n=1 Tax=Gordonia liuliyuniae TaxID=2911517 RepID=A0ABS9INZ1_9ACTN|nr:TetR/AcrR family transcriptional regulator [Gordonia liuliyuniae]MCF8587291.1 TetR/AcrR family transcriptional regulator [Gordonia liuliyuniae]